MKELRTSTYLCLVLVTVMIISAGCVDSDGVKLSETDNISVNEGEKKTVTVTAESVQSISVLYKDSTPKGETIESGPIDVLDTKLSPRPSHGLERYPPIWKWDRKRNVDMNLVINATDTGAGVYNYSVETDGGSSEFRVTVEDSKTN